MVVTVDLYMEVEQDRYDVLIYKGMTDEERKQRLKNLELELTKQLVLDEGATNVKINVDVKDVE